MRRLPREKQSDCEVVASFHGLPWELRPKRTAVTDRLIAAPRRGASSTGPVKAMGASVPSVPELTEINEPEAKPVEVTQEIAYAILQESPPLVASPAPAPEVMIEADSPLPEPVAETHHGDEVMTVPASKRTPAM